MSILPLSLTICGLSLAGGLAPRFLSARLSERQLRDTTGIASGLLLASALLVVIPEGFHLAAESAPEGEAFSFEPAMLGATVLAGFIAMLLLEGLGLGHAVHEEHHDHAEGHGHDHVHHPTSGTVLAIGLSVHAMADGLAIGAAAAAGETAFSVLVAIAVMIHRVPAAFSLGLFTAHEHTASGNDKDSKGLQAIIAFSLATPVMILVAYLLLDGAAERLIALTLLFSAGTFVYVATVDTLPEIHNRETGTRSVITVLAGAALFTVILLVADSAGLLSHSH